MSFIVYIHTCPNGKKYVGVTTENTPKRRWRDGDGYKSQNHFYRAIQKYGWDNIVHDVFETESEELMMFWEKILIFYYDTTNPNNGYNKASGGNGPFGVKRSEETREKLSKSHLGHIVTEETKKKISQTLKGRRIQVHSEETCMKISQTLKGRKLSEEHKKKISNGQLGRIHSEETKRKMSESMKLYYENKRKNNT